MAFFELLDEPQRRRAMRDATDHNGAVSIATLRNKRWFCLRCIGLTVDGDALILKMPATVTSAAVQAFVNESNAFVMVTVFNRNHLFTTEVRGLRRFEEEGRAMLGLEIVMPGEIRRVARRSSSRVSVPPSARVRATIWAGGCDENCLAPGPGEVPTWTGSVLDVSNGGFLLRVQAEAGELLGHGDVVGLQLTFGSDEEAVYADANLCHVQTDGRDMVLLGFRFAGIANQPTHREAFLYYLSKVRELQALQEAV